MYNPPTSAHIIYTHECMRVKHGCWSSGNGDEIDPLVPNLCIQHISTPKAFGVMCFFFCFFFKLLDLVHCSPYDGYFPPITVYS